jgi:hypothetical protein
LVAGLDIVWPQLLALFGIGTIRVMAFSQGSQLTKRRLATGRRRRRIVFEGEFSSEPRRLILRREFISVGGAIRPHLPVLLIIRGGYDFDFPSFCSLRAA